MKKIIILMMAIMPLFTIAQVSTSGIKNDSITVNVKLPVKKAVALVCKYNVKARSASEFVIAGHTVEVIYTNRVYSFGIFTPASEQVYTGTTTKVADVRKLLTENLTSILKE